MNWRVRLSLSRTVFIDWKGKRGQNLQAIVNIFVDENFSVIHDFAQVVEIIKS